MKISVIIPVYNGERTIASLNLALLAYFKTSLQTFEIIYVYDCGHDNSWNELLLLKDTYPEIITLVMLTRNYGQHNAIIAGFEMATGDFMVTMDEDLQHLPEDIEKLILVQKNADFDIVYGYHKADNHGTSRNLTSNILRRMLSWAIPELHKDYSAFRLLRANVAKKTVEMSNSYTFLDGYLSWITNNIGATPVRHNKRIAGNSSYTLKKLISHSINIFVTFSNLPIRLLSYSSLTVFAFTVLYSIYIILRKLFYNDLLQGYPTIIITLGFGISLILLGLGVIGEYLYRINLKTTKRPNYIIKTKI